MNYYVPSVLLVVISWVSFWEAPDALPGRTLLGKLYGRTTTLTLQIDRFSDEIGKILLSE